MQRFKVLDAFRGISILSVMLYHYTKTFRIVQDPGFDPALDYSYGYLGVHFFFVISGFVIYLTLNHSSSAGNFLYKRFSRLYPTFWFCVLLSFTVLLFFPLKGDTRLRIPELAGNLTMIPGFFNIPRVDGAYWSLVPEFFFYLAMAILFLMKRTRTWLYWGIAVMMVSWINAFILPVPEKLQHPLNITWGALFFAGILFYKCRSDKKNILLHLLILVSFATTCLYLKGLEGKLVLAFIYLLFYLFAFDKLNWLNWKPLVVLGRISFPLYLLHQKIGFVIMTGLSAYLENQLVLMSIAMALMILLAWAVHHAIELPSIRLLRQLIKKPVDAAALPATPVMNIPNQL